MKPTDSNSAPREVSPRPTTPPPAPPSARRSAREGEAIIARALRASAIALVGLAVVIGGLAFWFKRKPATPPPKLQVLAAPALPQRAVAAVPTAKFTDVTAAAGIGFVHHNGAYGDKLLPETMGGGCAFFDFDNDGAPDLLFVNSTDWPWHRVPGQPAPTLALYHNDGQGRFQDVTAGSGLDVSLYGMGCAMGDYDNDGLPDVLVTTVGGARLFRNLGGGKFEDVTAAAGVGGDPGDWSTSAAWIDYDNDGKLDLFVCNYVRWTRAIDFEVGYKLVGLGRAYGPPMNFEGTLPRLYHNEGNGRFTDVSAASGVQIRNPATGAPMAKSLGVAPIDLDGDGWIDLVVANDTVQNFVFHNQRDGTFKEIGAVSGLAFDSYGNARGAMGIDAARFRNDEAIGVGIGNFANEMTALYVATPQNRLLFTDEAIGEGVGPASRLPLKFGLLFLDYDLDGWLDLLTANGHLEEEIGKVQASQHYAQSAQLFWNSGGTPNAAGFVLAPPERTGPDLLQPIVGRGVACADLDGDGDLDVVLTQIGGRPLLLRNDQRLGHHYLRLKLVGTRCNRDAIGAWVRVRVGSQVLARQVMPTRGYLSQSELAVTIGLGEAAGPDAVEIDWPGGARQDVRAARVDGLTVVEQQSP